MSITEDTIRTTLYHAILEAGSLRELARRWRFSPAFLSDVMRGRRGFGPRLLKRLGYTAQRKAPTYTYERV